MPRPLVATIDIAAMQHNVSLAKNCAPNSRLWAVVKANAYGHRLEHAIRGFSRADGLTLIEPMNAVRLRELGWKKPILLLEGCFDAADLSIVVDHQLDITIHCDEQIEMLEKANITQPVDVFLKMNSGMNRLGFLPQEFRVAYTRLQAIPAVRKIVLMTHFANAEAIGNAGLPFNEQLRRFNNAIEGLDAERSLANSAAILTHPEVAADWIRPGIMLYGATPGGKTATEFGLKPAMTLTSEIIATQNVGPGEAVGYGSLFIADKPMKIGVVACGYADGYPRHAPTGTPVIVDGYKTRLVGRVSMDMITVDLTPVPTAHVGSAVVLWGDGLPIDEVAAAAGTIGYELMCALSSRVHTVEKMHTNYNIPSPI